MFTLAHIAGGSLLATAMALGGCALGVGAVSDLVQLGRQHRTTQSGVRPVDNLVPVKIDGTVTPVQVSVDPNDASDSICTVEGGREEDLSHLGGSLSSTLARRVARQSPALSHMMTRKAPKTLATLQRNGGRITMTKLAAPMCVEMGGETQECLFVHHVSTSDEDAQPVVKIPLSFWKDKALRFSRSASSSVRCSLVDAAEAQKRGTSRRSDPLRTFVALKRDSMEPAFVMKTAKGELFVMGDNSVLRVSSSNPPPGMMIRGTGRSVASSVMDELERTYILEDADREALQSCTSLCEVELKQRGRFVVANTDGGLVSVSSLELGFAPRLALSVAKSVAELCVGSWIVASVISS